MCLDYSAAATKTESQCNLQGIREKRSQQPGGEKTWLVHLSLNSGVPAQHFQWLSSVLLLVLCLALLATTSRGLCVARSVWSGRHSNEIESGFFGLAGRQIARPAFKLLELSSPPPHPPPPLSLWPHIIMYTLWSSFASVTVYSTRAEVATRCLVLSPLAWELCGDHAHFNINIDDDLQSACAD